MDNAMLKSPSTLAFVGDAVFGLLVRTYLSEVECPIGEMHKKSVDFVNANAQTKAFEIIKDMLTEKEMSVFKRGRNNHVGGVPKSTTVASYHTATGVEALFGYLHLSGQTDRINQLFSAIVDGMLNENM
jgi:ribonuclease-3 family protein